MFGRILDIYFENGESRVRVVDSDQGNKSLVCEATITCMPSTARTTLELKIYNLDRNVRKKLDAEDYRKVSVYFGYKDENSGKPSRYFEGTIVRTITQRDSPETSITTYYAQELGDEFEYGFYSGVFEEGTSVYDAVTAIAAGGEVEVPIYISNYYKHVYIARTESVYGSQIDLIKQFISGVKGSLIIQAMGRLNIITKKENSKSEVIVFSGVNENGKIVSTSGLIDIPALTDDGLSLACLPNPNIRIYSTILLANSLITEDQIGITKKSIAGAEYDRDGLYVVTRITTTLTNGAGKCAMSLRALARQYYEEDEE